MSITIDGTNGITQSGPSKANAYLDAAGGNTATINSVLVALASQAQAQAGTDNTTLMTPLRASQAISALGGLGGVNIQAFTASGTYTPTSGYKWGIAFVTGGGGGGYNGTGGAGAAGGTAIKVFDLVALGSVSVTVGAGGNAGVAGGSSIISTVTATGGSQGLAGSTGGNAGVAVGGNVNLYGGTGRGTSTTSNGGGSFYGTNGAAGTGGASGSAGSAGIVFIMEFK